MHRLKSWLDSLPPLPSRCLWCDRQGCHAIRNLCSECFASLPWNTNPCPICALPLTERGDCEHCLEPGSALDSISAPLLYRWPLDSWISRFKDQSNLYYLPLFKRAICTRIDCMTPCDQVIPVPLHWRRKLRRGFNQAELLARPLARALQQPLANDCLRRRGARRNQKELNRKQRLANLEGVFSSHSVEGKRVLLVDDVTTTGATLEQAAHSLRIAGATEVRALVLARTPRPGG